MYREKPLNKILSLSKISALGGCKKVEISAYLFEVLFTGCSSIPATIYQLVTLVGIGWRKDNEI